MNPYNDNGMVLSEIILIPILSSFQFTIHWNLRSYKWLYFGMALVMHFTVHSSIHNLVIYLPYCS